MTGKGNTCFLLMVKLQANFKCKLLFYQKKSSLNVICKNPIEVYVEKYGLRMNKKNVTSR